jgi:hypothetical protein
VEHLVEHLVEGIAAEDTGPAAEEDKVVGNSAEDIDPAVVVDNRKAVDLEGHHKVLADHKAAEVNVLEAVREEVHIDLLVAVGSRPADWEALHKVVADNPEAVQVEVRIDLPAAVDSHMVAADLEALHKVVDKTFRSRGR